MAGAHDSPRADEVEDGAHQEAEDARLERGDDREAGAGVLEHAREVRLDDGVDRLARVLDHEAGELLDLQQRHEQGHDKDLDGRPRVHDLHEDVQRALVLALDRGAPQHAQRDQVDDGEDDDRDDKHQLDQEDGDRGVGRRLRREGDCEREGAVRVLRGDPQQVQRRARSALEDELERRDEQADDDKHKGDEQTDRDAVEEDLPLLGLAVHLLVRRHDADPDVLVLGVRLRVLGGAVEVDGDVGQDQRHDRGDAERRHPVHRLDRDGDRRGVLDGVARRREVDVEPEADDHHDHHERVEHGPFAERVEQDEHPLALLHGEDVLRAEPRDEDQEDLDVRPRAGKDGDEDGQRIDAGLPHVGDGVPETKVEERAQLNRVFALARVDHRHDTRGVRGVRGQEEGGGEERQNRKGDANADGDLFVEEQRAADARFGGHDLRLLVLLGAVLRGLLFRVGGGGTSSRQADHGNGGGKLVLLLVSCFRKEEHQDDGDRRGASDQAARKRSRKGDVGRLAALRPLAVRAVERILAPRRGGRLRPLLQGSADKVRQVVVEPIFNPIVHTVDKGSNALLDGALGVATFRLSGSCRNVQFKCVQLQTSIDQRDIGPREQKGLHARNTYERIFVQCFILGFVHLQIRDGTGKEVSKRNLEAEIGFPLGKIIGRLH